MDDFLTAVSTTKVKHQKEPEQLIKISFETGNGRTSSANFESPEEISKILKSQPDVETIIKVLQYLAAELRNPTGFNLVTPGPVSAQIVDTIVSITIPDYWKILKEGAIYDKQLVRCLQNANGLGAILSRLRPLIADYRQKKPIEHTRDPSSHIGDLIDVLERIISGDRTSSHIWYDIRRHAANPIQKKLMWKEYVAQAASGRILSAVAEAEDVLKEHGTPRTASWLASGNDYASWLGSNLVNLMKDNIDVEESASAVTELSAKALGIGYHDRVAASIVKFMVDSDSTKAFETYLPKMKAHEQRKYFNAILTSIVNQYPGSLVDNKDNAPLKATSTVSGIARLVHSLTKDNELLQDHCVTALIQSSVPALDDSLAARRSLIAALAQDEDKLQNVLEKALRLFGDSFWIAHTPILHQEALAQTLAITCGYIQRTQPMFLIMMAKSSYHVSGMSNRMAATSPRARFLGMAVGVAISKMVDKLELQLKFEFEGSEAIEANWYQRLTEVNDKIGNIKDLQTKDKKEALASAPKPSTKGISSLKTAKNLDSKPKTLGNTEIIGPRVIEILDESSGEDDDLVPYEKPDSDPEDDTDDPTEINRNKPTPPVYIRDLISGLRDQDNYERHQLALSTSASLIRRKANFGSEVIDHIEELASILTGLNDNLDLPDFNQHRQQALIAVLLAKPGPMAQWFSRSFFSGDYSIAQRIAMLTTLGLGARELAGLKDSSTDDLIPPAASFPSKALPPHLHKIYASNSTTDPVNYITGNLTKQILSPIAAKAADQLTGPDILKVRKFSTRMEVEQRRSKPIPNALAQIVADNFFFPLTGRWWITTRSSSSSSSNNDNIYTSTHLLPPLLRTLAILLHASGPSTLSLPQMTREFWELLLSVRTFAVHDKNILSALLFSLLMLLETNEDKERLATEQARELLETQEWVRMVFEGLGAGSEEDEKVRVLAAGVVVRCQEVVERYQRRMVGSMLDY